MRSLKVFMLMTAVALASPRAEAAVAGNVLTCTNGGWSSTNAPTSFNYTFLRNGAAFQGPNATNTYTVVSGDVGTSITCETTGILGANSTVSSPSNAVAVSGGAVTTGVHAIGAAGGSGVVTNTVALTGVTAGQLITGEYTYCQDTNCTATGKTALTPTSITSSVSGTTCTHVAADSWAAGTNTFGTGVFICAGAPAGNHTLTVNMPSDSSYLQIWAQSWTASGIDGGCAIGRVNTTASTSWSLPTNGAASVTGTVPLSLVFPVVTGTSTSNGTILDTDTKGRIASYLWPPQTTTGPFTMSGTMASSAVAMSIVCVKP